jgi:integrase
MLTSTPTNIAPHEGRTKPGRRPRGSGSLFKRKSSLYWWVQYHRNGKTYRESSQTTKESEALRFLRKKLADAASEFFIAPQTARIKVSELAEDFDRDQKIRERKAAADANTRWKLHLKPFFGHLRAVQVGTDLLSRYIVERQEKGAANATINRELACLKRMFNLGAQSSPPKVLRVPKFPRLTERNVRTGFVEDGDYSKLADACAGIGVWMRALFETAYNYGWRISELQNLKVRQIDLLSKTIRLNSGETKNDDGRLVVMTSRVQSLMSECVSGKQPDESVFTRSGGKAVKDFRVAWEKVCTQAGLPGLLFHDLRRTAVRNMVRSGIPEVVAMRISGHRTRAIFDRYNIVSESDLREAAGKLDNRADTLDAVQRSEQPGHPAIDASALIDSRPI